MKDSLSLHLYSFKEFDKKTGIYTTSCVCGGRLTLLPKDIISTTVYLSCDSCYGKYRIHCSCNVVLNESHEDLDIGIASFYLHQYDNSIKYYLLYQKENEGDSEVAKDIEFNIYEAFHKKYIEEKTLEGKEQCVTDFHSLYPYSTLDITKNYIQNYILDIESIEELCEEKLQILKSICDKIEKNKNSLK